MRIITVEAGKKPLAEIAKKAITEANSHEEALVEVALDFFGKRVTMRVAPHADPESVCEGLTKARNRNYDLAIWDNKFKILDLLPQGTNIRINQSDIWVELPSSARHEEVMNPVIELLYLKKADKINGLNAFKIEKTPELDILFKQLDREVSRQSQPSRQL